MARNQQRNLDPSRAEDQHALKKDAKTCAFAGRRLYELVVSVTKRVFRVREIVALIVSGVGDCIRLCGA